MENPEGVLILLDEFSKMKSKEIPSDLEEYLLYVAASGDPVYQWSLIKSLYRQKLINVITEFYETCPMMDIPPCPNVDPFNYETMKNSLLERLDSFANAPFTIQRISELLTTPRKQYNRVDKFMRAIEKNIWVVSTREPGQRESASNQETSGNLVNGVSPRVRVKAKHPKRGKSIKERIKSGHPQLIDDDDDDEDEEEDGMEVKSNQDTLMNSDSEETPSQCTSVKDLIEKYENGTIFCGTAEKNVQVGESAVSTETSGVSSGGVESTDNSSEHESDEEEVNIDKLVTSDESLKDALIQSSESEIDTKNALNETPIVEVLKEDDPVLSESCPAESSDFCSEINKPDTTDRSDDNSNSNEETENVTVLEVLGLENEAENNENEPILEEPDSEDSVNVAEKEKANEAEVKEVGCNEAEAASEVQEYYEDGEEKNRREDDSEKKLDSNEGVVTGSEPDSSSDEAVAVEAPALGDSLDFVKEELEEKSDSTEVSDKSVESSSVTKELTDIGCATTEFESFNKSNNAFDRIEDELCLQSELLESKMEVDDSEEKSSDMAMEEGEGKTDEMDVEESQGSSSAKEESAEAMDVTD